MTEVTLWHNPRCSKSRAALKFLEEAGHQVTVRRYLDTPPTGDEIRSVHTQLGGTVRDMMRVKEAAFATAGLHRDSPDADLVAAMAAHPILIERPIALAQGKAALGRPPEAVLAIV